MTSILTKMCKKQTPNFWTVVNETLKFYELYLFYFSLSYIWFAPVSLRQFESQTRAFITTNFHVTVFDDVKFIASNKLQPGLWRCWVSKCSSSSFWWNISGAERCPGVWWSQWGNDCTTRSDSATHRDAVRHCYSSHFILNGQIFH